MHSFSGKAIHDVSITVVISNDPIELWRFLYLMNRNVICLDMLEHIVSFCSSPFEYLKFFVMKLIYYSFFAFSNWFHYRLRLTTYIFTVTCNQRSMWPRFHDLMCMCVCKVRGIEKWTHSRCHGTHTFPEANYTKFLHFRDISLFIF